MTTNFYRLLISSGLIKRKASRRFHRTMNGLPAWVLVVGIAVVLGLAATMRVL